MGKIESREIICRYIWDENMDSRFLRIAVRDDESEDDRRYISGDDVEGFEGQYMLVSGPEGIVHIPIHRVIAIYDGSEKIWQC